MGICSKYALKFKTLLLFSMAVFFHYSSWSQTNAYMKIYERYENSQWVNGFKYLTTYNENNKVATDIRQVWDSSSETWLNSSKSIFSYNSQSKVTEILFKGWDSENSIWFDYGRRTYSYDPDGKLITVLDELWNYMGTNVWQTSAENEYTYDANGFLVQILSYGYDEFEVLSNSGRILYTNLSNGLVDYWIDQTWENDHWDNLGKYQYTYTPTGKVATQTLSTQLGNLQWQVLSRINSFYDSADNRINQSVEELENNVWVPFSQSTTNYHPNNSVDFQWGQQYDNGSWQDSFRQTWYYETLGIPETENQNQIIAYPNPASNHIIIKTTEENNGSHYAIVDVNGKSILNGNILFPESNVDISKLQNGMYLILIENSKPIKFIKN